MIAEIIGKLQLNTRNLIAPRRKRSLNGSGADNKKAQRLLKWQPKFAGLDGLRRGLGITIEWFSVRRTWRVTAPAPQYTNEITLAPSHATDKSSNRRARSHGLAAPRSIAIFGLFKWSGQPTRKKRAALAPRQQPTSAW